MTNTRRDDPGPSYALLGLLPGRYSAEALRRAFGARALDEHPDRSPRPDAALRFQRILAAYRELLALAVQPDERQPLRPVSPPRTARPTAYAAGLAGKKRGTTLDLRV